MTSIHFKTSESRVGILFPRGLQWRSSQWFVTTVVALGLFTDIALYTMIIPIIPFRLEQMGYRHDRLSGLSSWLLFAFTISLILATPPIAYISEASKSRRPFMLAGLVSLAGSTVLLMEAPFYALLVVARVIQGVSSSIVWVVGLSLLYDTVPEDRVGQQAGLVMFGFTLGSLIAPPVAGALYDHFGYRSPFIFGLAVIALDAIGRLLVIERQTAVTFGFDPQLTSKRPNRPDEPEEKTSQGISGQDGPEPSLQVANEDERRQLENVNDASSPPLRLSPFKVLVKLSKSSRVLTTLVCTAANSFTFSALETTMTLRLQAVWGLDSGKVGLVFLAAGAPSLFMVPIWGMLGDRYGLEWLTFLPYLLSIPWEGALISRKSLALFIVAESCSFTLQASALSALLAEASSVTRTMPGIEFGHMNGGFNLAYGIGNAIGPVIAGQIYDHVSSGWVVVCCLFIASSIVASSFAFRFTGERPLWFRLKGYVKSSPSVPR